jgi:hypothetical protein
LSEAKSQIPQPAASAPTEAKPEPRGRVRS